MSGVQFWHIFNDTFTRNPQFIHSSWRFSVLRQNSRQNRGKIFRVTTRFRQLIKVPYIYFIIFLCKRNITQNLMLLKLLILLRARPHDNYRQAAVPSISIRCGCFFLALSQNCEKHLLVSSCFVCLSVCPSARNSSAPNGRILIKFNFCVFFENPLRKFQFN
jgi:hypothetical protein